MKKYWICLLPVLSLLAMNAMASGSKDLVCTGQDGRVELSVRENHQGEGMRYDQFSSRGWKLVSLLPPETTPDHIYYFANSQDDECLYKLNLQTKMVTYCHEASAGYTEYSCE
jgi:hypothetical protein